MTASDDRSTIVITADFPVSGTVMSQMLRFAETCGTIVELDGVNGQLLIRIDVTHPIESIGSGRMKAPNPASLTDRLRVAFPSRHNLDACADLIDAIDALHQSEESYVVPFCTTCQLLWPCPTHRLTHPESETHDG